MDTAISLRKTIKGEKLDRQNYTLSLLKEGYRLGIITAAEMNSCHSQIMMILRELILKYTGGASSSVRLEKAQTLLLSILYTIDAAWLELDDPTQAIGLIKSINVHDLYDRGSDILREYYESTRSLFNQVIEHQLPVNVQTYRMTIDQALPDFIDHYDLTCRAHDTMADIDYPLVFDDMDLPGIYYVKHYMEILELETSFCRCYRQDKINNLLAAYGRTFRLDPSQEFFNIFELVLNNAIFRVLIDQSAGDLSISGAQLKSLQQRLVNCRDEALAALIVDAVDRVIEQLGIQNHALKLYMHQYVDTLLPRLRSALQHGYLDNIALVDDESEAAAGVLFDTGLRMSDSDFRSLVSAIMDSGTTQERIGQVMTGINSLSDFIDLLETDCLLDEDWPVLFGSLGDMELSVLARITYLEHMKSDPVGFTLSRASLESPGKPWQVEYDKFLKELDRQRLDSIGELLRLSLHT